MWGPRVAQSQGRKLRIGPPMQPSAALSCEIAPKLDPLLKPHYFIDMLL
jgi:hypothetical protein